MTFLCYVVVLFFIHDPGAAPNETGAPASYRAVLRHRTFLGLWVLNFLFVAAGYSLIILFPQFARDQSGISERQIGLVFAVNTGVIVLAQLPLSHLIEGKRRMRALALMPLLWAVRLAARRRDRLLARGDRGVRRVRGRARAVRDRRVLPRPRAPGARRRHRAPSTCAAATSPSTRCRGASPAPSGRRSAASSSRRAPFALWPLASVVCLVAAGGALVDGALHPAGAAANPARRGRDPGARRAGARLTLRIGDMLPIVEDPLSTGGKVSLNAQPAPDPPYAQSRPHGRRRARRASPLSSAPPGSPGSISTPRRSRSRQELAERFGWHPLDVEDVLSQRQRPEGRRLRRRGLPLRRPPLPGVRPR